MSKKDMVVAYVYVRQTITKEKKLIDAQQRISPNRKKNMKMK